MATESTTSIVSCTGGLLGVEESLHVLWLALRTDGHISVAHSVLLRECVASASPPQLGAAEEHIRSGNPRLYVPNLRLPWACELKEQVRKHTGLQMITVADRSTVLRAREVLDVLSGPCCYGARWNEMVRLFYTPLSFEFAQYNDFILRSLGVFDVLRRISNLVRLAYLNRLLAVLRRRSTEIRNERDRVRNAESPVQPISPPPLSTTTNTRMNLSMPSTESPRTPVLGRCPVPPHIAKLRRFCLVKAEPVRDSSRSASSTPREYIVGGICVPAHLLNDVESTLVRDYRLYIQVAQPAHPRYATHPTAGSLASLANHGTALLDHPPVCNVISPLLEPLPPAVAPAPTRNSNIYTPPTPPVLVNPSPLRTIHPGHPPPLHLGAHRGTNLCIGRAGRGSPPGSTISPRHLREHSSVEQYLRNCFGVGWSATLNAALRNARRQQRERQLGSLCTKLTHVEESLKAGNELRERLMDTAVKHDMNSSGLAGCCAISLARKITSDEVEQEGHDLPVNVLKKVKLAKNRLSVLHSRDAISIDAII